jgi:hypothetical protein
MRRVILSLAALVLVSASATALHAGETARARELRRMLSQTVKSPGFDDPKARVIEALDALAKRYNLSFDLNERAFKDAGIPEVGRFEFVGPNPVPEMNARLGTVLEKVLQRISPKATYIVRDEVIEITTKRAVRKEFFGDRRKGPLPPLISASFAKQPLEAALKDLTEARGVNNIILDSRTAKEAAMPVTADFVNVPLDTAVRMLADMAGLKVVPLDNALYVTSEHNARALLQEREMARPQHPHGKKPKKEPDGKSTKPPPPKTANAPSKGES